MTQRQIAYRGVHRIEWLWYDKAKRQPFCLCVCVWGGGGIIGPTMKFRHNYRCRVSLIP